MDYFSMDPKKMQDGRLSVNQAKEEMQRKVNILCVFFVTPLCLLIVGCFTVHKVVFSAILVK